jgi:peptidyl-Lys metalloendopeptidase
MKLNGVKLYLAVAMAAVIACLAFSSTASAMPAGARGLTTTIESYGNHAGPADDVMLRVTYHNGTAEDLYLLSWQTALNGVEGNLFDVSRDGQPVEYTGRLYKRGFPRAEDYVRIPAGGSLSADVELSGVYDMSRTGEYAIRYRANVQDALRADGRTKVANVAGIGLRELESNTLFLAVERNERAVDAIETLAAIEEAVRPSVPTKYQTPSYVSCSTTRQSSLVTALSNAQSISLKARNHLSSASSPSTDSAYRTWFGAYTSSRYSTVQSHYNNIYSAFVNQRFTFYCDCTDSSYAWVYANQPYRVHLCNAFWSAPSLGIDSKAGTLVHEASHFTVVAGTQDYAYGQTACKNLAISNPSRAVNNADNHEYFAETRP